MNYLSEYAWMQTLGWTLLHSFWQIGLIALSWAILRPFLKNSSSEKRYLALMGAILTAFICAAITFWQLLPKQAELSIIRVSTIELSEMPASQQAPVILSEVESERSWTHFFNQIAPYLSVLWIIGAVIMGIRFSGGIFYIQKLRYKGLQMVDERWQIKAQNLANKLRIKQNWQLKESERVSQPLTIGHFKPLILVPLGMLSALSPDQVEAIILHELAHIKRSDFLFNLIQSLIEILFFYHPAIWWLSKEIRQEREMCCDDLAVEAMGDAFTYAETLTLLQSYRHSPQQFLTMKAKGNTYSFSKRIKRLFQENPRPSPWRSISATILLVLILSGSGFYAFTQTQKRNQEDNSDIETQEILAEYIIEPEMSKEEFNKVTAAIFTYDPQKMLIANRNSEDLIEELVIFGIYNPNPKRPAQKFYKTGLRNFSKAKISIIKTQKGKPMVSLKDPVGDAIWTDKLDQQTVSLKVGDKADKLIKWVKLQQQKGAEVAIEEIDVDPSNGNLLSYKMNKEGPQGDQAIYLPSAETILYSGEGSVFFMTSHALPRIVNSSSNQEPKKLKEFPPQLLNQVASPPVWVFLDNKSVGSFESSDGLQQRLIEQGVISSSKSIGQASYYSIQNGDFTEMLDAENLAPPSQGLDSLPEIFNVYVLNTWEHLAEKFSQEGPQKHRLYFFGENRIGFRKGLIEEVVREISGEQKISAESVSVKIFRGSEAEKKYKIKGIEIVEISNESNEQFNPEENRADVIGRLILYPQTSKIEFSQFSQLVQDKLYQRPRVTRDQNGQIQSFYMIYEEGHRIYKMGISDFKQLDLILRKEEDGRVIFEWARGNQDNIWTREMDHQYVQIFPNDPIEKLTNWIDKINQSHGSGLTIVDSKSKNGKLQEITVSQTNPGGANVAQSTVPTEVSILYDETGKVFSFGVKGLDPNHKEDISKLTFLNTYPTNVNTYPDKEAIEIVMKVQSQLLADVKIIDLSGKVFVEEKGVQFGPQTIALLISIANCPNGIYFANIQTADGQIFNKKFVIKR